MRTRNSRRHWIISPLPSSVARGGHLLRLGSRAISAGDQLRAGEKFDAAKEIYGQIGAAQRWIDRVEEARSAGCTVSLDRAQRERPGAEPSSTRAGVTKGSDVPNVSIATSCSFQREGDFWTISYRDHTFRLKDMKGLYYIAHLLAHPGEQFHVHELVIVVDRAARADDTIPARRQLRVTNDLGDAGAILDPRAKAEYRSRLAELQSELADAEAANDGGRAERIREELETLEEQLATAVGLGGRDRKAADHAERTRSRVGRAIRNSLRSIRENVRRWDITSRPAFTPAISVPTALALKYRSPGASRRPFPSTDERLVPSERGFSRLASWMANKAVKTGHTAGLPDSKRQSSETSRERSAVTRAIGAAIKRIALDDPELAQPLKCEIRIGQLPPTSGKANESYRIVRVPLEHDLSRLIL